METLKFTKLLRKVIREEVQSIVRKEVRAALNEGRVDHKKVIDYGMDLHNVANSVRKPSTKKTKFVKDSMLNDILNETANGSDFSTMNDVPSIYETSAAPDFVKNKRQPTETLATHDINGKPVNLQNKNVAKTVDLMTKDYSQLMKAIDKKKGN